MPEHVRGQYLTQIQAAERWELSIGDLIELGRAQERGCETVPGAARQAGLSPQRFKAASPSEQIRSLLLLLWLGPARAASIYKMAG
jgi:hypothetical protein